MKHNCYNCTNKDCLNCRFNLRETYNYQHGMDKKTCYIDETFQISTNEKSESDDKIGNLNEEQEDRMRIFIYNLFDLEPLEFMMLKSIINGKSLTEFSNEMNKIMQKLQKNGMTRFHSFQLRKSLKKKLGKQFESVLLTSGQRKKIK